jgi:hypothetical protein
MPARRHAVASGQAMSRAPAASSATGVQAGADAGQRPVRRSAAASSGTPSISPPCKATACAGVQPGPRHHWLASHRLPIIRPMARPGRVGLASPALRASDALQPPQSAAASNSTASSPAAPASGQTLGAARCAKNAVPLQRSAHQTTTGSTPLANDQPRR